MKTGMMRLRSGQLRFGMRRRNLISLLGGAALIWPHVTRAADDAQKLADRAIQRLDLQTDFPRVPEPLQFRLQLPDEVLWLVIIIAIGVLLYAFRDMIPGLGFGRNAAWAEDEANPDDASLRTPEATLGAADELAAHGRFVDAMHTLLLQGLANIRERLNEQFADSQTSREILYSTKLPREGRASLHDIVTRVEWTYFGERPATRTDYDACRASFTALAESLRRGTAA
jgi:hypothetical protein